MSMQAYYYKDVDGESAFAAGYTEAYADIFLVPCCDMHFYVETDVFADDGRSFDEIIKERLGKYNKFEKKEKVKRQLEKFQYIPKAINCSAEEALFSCFQIKNDIEKRRGLIKRFLTEVEYQLGKVKEVYTLNTCGTLDDAFSVFYTYMSFSVVILKYEDSYLMVVFGTNE